MFTLSLPILAWFVFLVLYMILALVSIVQMFRHGSAGPMAYVSTCIFIVVVLAVTTSVVLFVMQIDWSTPITIPTTALTPFVTP